MLSLYGMSPPPLGPPDCDFPLTYILSFFPHTVQYVQRRKQKKKYFSKKSRSSLLLFVFTYSETQVNPATLKQFFPRASRRVWLVYHSYFCLPGRYKQQHFSHWDLENSRCKLSFEEASWSRIKLYNNVQELQWTASQIHTLHRSNDQHVA
jgi:hypothetical protein